MKITLSIIVISVLAEISSMAQTVFALAQGNVIKITSDGTKAPLRQGWGIRLNWPSTMPAICS